MRKQTSSERSRDHYRRAAATTPRVALDAAEAMQWGLIQQRWNLPYTKVIRRMIAETFKREIGRG